MRILVLRVIPAMTGIRPKHISHLGFVGDLTGPHGVRAYRVLREIRAPAVGAREPPALAVAGGDLPLPKPFKGRDLGLETAWNLANVGSHSSMQRSRLVGVLGSSTGGGRVSHA